MVFIILFFDSFVKKNTPIWIDGLNKKKILSLRQAGKRFLAPAKQARKCLLHIYTFPGAQAQSCFQNGLILIAQNRKQAALRCGKCARLQIV